MTAIVLQRQNAREGSVSRVWLVQSWGEGQMGPGYGAPTVPMVAGTKNHQAKASGLRGLPEKSPNGRVVGTREKTPVIF